MGTGWGQRVNQLHSGCGSSPGVLYLKASLLFQSELWDFYHPLLFSTLLCVKHLCLLRKPQFFFISSTLHLMFHTPEQQDERNWNMYSSWEESWTPHHIRGAGELKLLLSACAPDPMHQPLCGASTVRMEKTRKRI